MDIDKEKDLLPVGTVVSVRFLKGKYMIVGFGTKTLDDEKIFDYSAVPYPSGLLSLDKLSVFDRIAIKKVYHLGFFTTEHNDFVKKVEEAMKKKRSADRNE